MTNIVQDDAISIDLQFGTIKFVRGSVTTFAIVTVEVSIEDASLAFDPGTKVMMDFRFPADPEVDTIAAVAKNARAHLVSRLRSAVEILEGQSAESLLYGNDAANLFAIGH